MQNPRDLLTAMLKLIEQSDLSVGEHSKLPREYPEFIIDQAISIDESRCGFVHLGPVLKKIKHGDVVFLRFAGTYSGFLVTITGRSYISWKASFKLEKLVSDHSEIASRICPEKKSTGLNFENVDLDFNASHATITAAPNIMLTVPGKHKFLGVPVLLNIESPHDFIRLAPVNFIFSPRGQNILLSLCFNKREEDWGVSKPNNSI